MHGMSLQEELLFGFAAEERVDWLFCAWVKYYLLDLLYRRFSYSFVVFVLIAKSLKIGTGVQIYKKTPVNQNSNAIILKILFLNTQIVNIALDVHAFSNTTGIYSAHKCWSISKVTACQKYCLGADTLFFV